MANDWGCTPRNQISVLGIWFMLEKLQRMSVDPFLKEKGSLSPKDCCKNVYAVYVNEAFK